MDDPIVWETVDRLGRIVRLHRSAWQHVMERHAELAERDDDARRVVAEADSIMQDRGFVNRELHRRDGRNSQPGMVVVVHYRPTPNGWIGSVITAFYRARPEKGSQRWP